MTKSLWLVLLLILPGSIWGQSQTADDRPQSQTNALAVSQIVLSISSDQVVGYPINGDARVLLLSDGGGLETSYDVAADPIELHVSRGSLSITTIDNPALFSQGIIDLSGLGTVFSGASGPVQIWATNSSVQSSPVTVSFAGYEIVGSSTPSGDSLTFVYQGRPANATVQMVNGGSLLAETTPSLSAYFASGGGSNRLFFESGNNGAVRVLTISLPTSSLTPGEDTLNLVLEASFAVDGSSEAVADTLRLPVDVLASPTVATVPNPVVPDSVHGGEVFLMSVRAAATELPQFDSVQIAVSAMNETDTALLFDGVTTDYYAIGDTLHFDSLAANPIMTISGDDGWLSIDLEVTWLAGASRIPLFADGADSLFLINQTSLSYRESTFEPTVLSGGRENEFSFTVDVGGNQDVVIDENLSYLTIMGDDFYTSTNLAELAASYSPGSHDLMSEPVYVPLDQLGTTLSVYVTIVYRAVGSGNSLSYQPSEPLSDVDVRELPLIQIIETSIVAPNAPNVNTDQDFVVRVSVANHDTLAQPSFLLSLSSDGNSVFEPLYPIMGIPAGETVDAMFSITASSTPDPDELFTSSIATAGLNEETPEDNIAVVTVQTPAEITFIGVLLNAEEGYVDIGEQFGLLFSFTNTGQSQASAATVEITSNGIDLGIEDPKTEVIPVGTPRGVAFEAPDFDTTVVIDAVLVDRPIDANTNLPARILGDTVVSFQVPIISPNVGLTVEATRVSSAVVAQDERKDIFELRFINASLSEVTHVYLDSLLFTFSDALGNRSSVTNFIDPQRSGLFIDDALASSFRVSGDSLVLRLEDRLIESEDTCFVVLKVAVTADENQRFQIGLTDEGVYAEFGDGPLSGDQAPIHVASDDGTIFEERLEVVGSVLSQSLVIRNNPFNPLIGPAEFSYRLSEAANVEFVVLTLTGHEVYHYDIPSGNVGAMAGENFLEWDGRNGNGDVVLNGVYVVVITESGTGQEARMKVAVAK